MTNDNFDDAISVGDPDGNDGVPVWLWVLIALGGLLTVIGLALGMSNAAQTDDLAPSPEPIMSASASASPSASVTPSPTPSEAPSESPSASAMPSPTDAPQPTDAPEPTPEPTDTAAPLPPSEFGDGVVTVGTDVQAGTYRTTTPVVVGRCAWLLQGANTGNPDYNLNPDLLAGGIPTVTMMDGDTFASRGCGTWSAVNADELFADPAGARAVLKDGVWLVGEDVRPGTYQTEPQDSAATPLRSCRWTLTESLDSNFTDVIVREYAITGEGKVAVAAGQQVESVNCGDWIPITK